MQVVFSTDFSPLARETGTAALRIARILGEPLELLHVMNPGLRDLTEVSPWAWRDFAEAQLEQERSRLGSAGVPVRVRLLEGPAEKLLAEHVAEHGAWAVIIPAPAAAKPYSPRAWFSAPRYALACPAPVILVRDPAALCRWLEGHTVLKVMLGIDRSPASLSAARWLAELRRIGPSDVLAELVYWPPAEHVRLGIRAPMRFDGRDPVEPLLLRNLEQLVGRLPGEGTLRLQVHGGFGRPAEHLLAHAREEDVDLLVIGSPPRLGPLRSRTSVAHQLVTRAPMSLASVCPRSPPEPRPGYRAVLVAVGSSDRAHEALDYALSVVSPDGRVHLVPFEPRGRWRARPRTSRETRRRTTHELARRREALFEIARELSPRTVQLSAEVVQRHDTALEIAQAASRIGAELICVIGEESTGRSRRLASAIASRLARGGEGAVLVLTCGDRTELPRPEEGEAGVSF